MCFSVFSVFSVFQCVSVCFSVFQCVCVSVQQTVRRCRQTPSRLGRPHSRQNLEAENPENVSNYLFLWKCVSRLYKKKQLSIFFWVWVIETAAGMCGARVKSCGLWKGGESEHLRTIPKVIQKFKNQRVSSSWKMLICLLHKLDYSTYNYAKLRLKVYSLEYELDWVNWSYDKNDTRISYLITMSPQRTNKHWR